jgi:hypothetical protein
MKIDNIPLKDHEAFHKGDALGQSHSHRVKKVQHKSYVSQLSEPLKGSKTVKVTKEQLKAIRELKAIKGEENVQEREIEKIQKDLSHYKAIIDAKPDPKASKQMIKKLCKMGLMSYINKHSIEHLNPSEVRKMDKEDLRLLAMNVKHIK